MSSSRASAQLRPALNARRLSFLGLFLGILQCTALAANSDIVINEIVAGASDRRLQWDANGVPHLGSGTPWQANSFNDATWQSGPGPFGFGTYSPGSVTYGTELTTQMLSLTPSLYLRKAFIVSATDAARTDQVQLVINYNDGFICFLNGVEVARRWAGPTNQFHYHDQPAYNPNLANTTTNPTTLYSETINLGAANTRLQAGTNVIAIQGLNWSITSQNFAVSATLQIPSITTFVNPTATWKYLPGVVEPSGGNYDPTQLGSNRLNVPWGTGTFDDSTWISGPGPLRIGSSGSGTNLPGVIGQTPSAYIRYVFNVTAAQASDTLPLKLLVDYDDSFVAYINGVEVTRANIGSPNVFTPHTAVANATHNNSTQTTFVIDPASDVLVHGDNVLAIQVHNVSVNDPDLYLQADLQTNNGTPLVSNNQTATYFAGTDEPVPQTAPDGEEEASPGGPPYDSDWVELYNTGSAPVSLNGWSLTDSSSKPAQWVFPNVTIPANGYLVVFCDGLDITSNLNGNLHTNFKLSSDGEYLGLYDQNGTLVQNFSPSFPKASIFYSYGRNANGDYVYFDTPTPGGPNAGNQATGIVANPTFSLSNGFYSAAQTVTLTCTTPGATIRYTTNGSEPTATTGTLYSSAISISSNTALRARAFAAGMIPSDTVTNTYLINESATRKSLPALCLTGDQQRTLYRPFGMMAIVNNNSTNYSGGVWFANNDPTQYNNPSVDFAPMERPASAELLYSGTPPSGASPFKSDIALRIAGSNYVTPRYILASQNASTNPNNGEWSNTSTEKPSFNLYFKGDYGTSPLVAPLFPNSPVTSFQDLRVRAGNNDHNPFILDEMMRRNWVAMGQVGALGILNTLYVDGVYKGFFNLCEHLREDFFQQSYNSTADWDVRQRVTIASGDGLAFQEMITYLRNNPQNVLANYQGMQARLDMTNFADYLLLNVVAATQDWPTNNYIVARERTDGALHHFHLWDAEASFATVRGDVTSNSFTSTANSFTPLITPTPQTDSLQKCVQVLYTLLKPSPEFRLLFADRIQRHLFNNGPIVEANIQARFNALKAQIQPFITNFIDPVTPWLNGNGTTPSRRQVLFGYTDSNHVFHQGHFVGEGLWPATSAPILSQYGGAIASGYQLTITNPNGGGTIYYTLNGSDPRAPGGGVVGTAYSGPITLTQTTDVRTRILKGTDWSPIIDVLFTVSQLPNLQMTEIMYNPPSQGATDGSAFEFLEFKNAGSLTINLGGMQLTDGVSYTFPSGSSLAPGSFAVLVKDPSAFATKYPSVAVTGTYQGSLANEGETVTLSDITGATIVSVTYSPNPPWPNLPGGYGNSLVPVDPNANPDPNNPANWRASSELGGSPGADDPPPTTPPILVNELLAGSDSPQVDEVELYNPTSQPADISGWFLSDSSTTPAKFRIPDGTIIPADGFLVYTESDFNPTPGTGNSFSFSSYGEEVRLSAADAAGNLTGYSHGFSFNASNPGVSFGRYGNSQGVESFPAQKTQTFLATNSGPLVGPVVITEMMYRPPSGDEYLELRNISNFAVPLYDPANPSNGWKINGIGYTFPGGISLAPGQIILVTQSGQRPAGTPSAIAVFGPYSGNLNNSGERITLRMPGTPYLDANNQTVVPYIDVDSVNYSPNPPWPTSANGGGPSLERINQFAYADDVLNWRASANGGTPGTLPAITFSTWQGYHFTAAQLGDPTISGASADPDHDDISNLLEFFFDSDPFTANGGSGITSYLATDGGTGPYLTIQFRHNLAASNVSYFGDTSGDPTNWNLGASVSILPNVNNGDGTETITLRDTVPVTGATRRFMRLRVISN